MVWRSGPIQEATRTKAVVLFWPNHHAWMMLVMINLMGQPCTLKWKQFASRWHEATALDTASLERPPLALQ
jgi:hypothetical protein